MKFASGVVLALVAATSNAAKNGLRRQLEKEHKRLPPGFMPIDLPDTESSVCDPDFTDDFYDSQYVVFLYNEKVTPDCVDPEDLSTLSGIAEAFSEIYWSASCNSGTYCLSADVEVVASDEFTFLLKVSSYCNSRSYFNDDPFCGVDLYSEEGFNMTSVDDSETCMCAGPTASSVVEEMNRAIVQYLSCDPSEEEDPWIVGTEQLCEIACHNPTESDGYMYGNMGVSLPCKVAPTSQPTSKPTSKPTSRPTRKPTQSPTDAPTFLFSFIFTIPGTDTPTVVLPETDPPTVAPPETNPPTVALPETDPPTVALPETDSPTLALPETDPPETDPPETDPPETDPPKTDPPETDPPETDPPETDPPKTDPPETDPPETDPPETDPPETDPPETDPPETDPPETDPPETDPPETDPPETDPPETDPPETDPPETDPPETDPPETDPPQTDPPQTDPPETDDGTDDGSDDDF